MENALITALNYILGWVQSLLAEALVLFLLVALAFVLFGISIVFYKIYLRIQGQVIVGTVIGAVKKVKVTIEDRKIIKKRLKHGSLWPVFEYTLADGTVRRDKGSYAGSHVYRYKTGQKVKLIVHQKGSDFDVSEAKSYFAYIFGVSSIFLGGCMIYIYLTEFYSQFNTNTLIWLGAIFSLALKYKSKIIKLIRDYKENSELKKSASKVRRTFDPEHLHPIEYFVNEGKKY